MLSLFYIKKRKQECNSVWAYPYFLDRGVYALMAYVTVVFVRVCVRICAYVCVRTCHRVFARTCRCVMCEMFARAHMPICLFVEHSRECGSYLIGHLPIHYTHVCIITYINACCPSSTSSYNGNS